jgi:hypothetical protein
VVALAKKKTLDRKEKERQKVRKKKQRNKVESKIGKSLRTENERIQER